MPSDDESPPSAIDQPSASGAPDALPDTDGSALERLKRFGGDKLMHEMIALYLSAAPERLAAARAGVAAGDVPGAELALHSLKSSSAQLGAMRVGRLSEEGENIARAGSLAGIPEILAAMDDELERVRIWLTAVREGGTT